MHGAMYELQPSQAVSASQALCDPHPGILHAVVCTTDLEWTLIALLLMVFCASALLKEKQNKTKQCF